MELILASGSQRRRELFSLMGLNYTIRVSEADENIPPCPPEQMVETLALRKAEAVKKDAPGACVVGADTIVYMEDFDEIIGKPRDEEDAYRILRKLSGRTHTVYTGLAVLTDAGVQCCHDTTRVEFAELSDEEIRAYIQTGEPMDKAGAYGVQGIASVFVKKVEGCYFTVIGLPVQKLYGLLKNVGICPQWQMERKEYA